MPPRRDPKQRNLWVFISPQSKTGKSGGCWLWMSGPSCAQGFCAIGCAKGQQVMASHLGLRFLPPKAPPAAPTAAALRDPCTGYVPQHLCLYSQLNQTEVLAKLTQWPNTCQRCALQPLTSPLLEQELKSTFDGHVWNLLKSFQAIPVCVKDKMFTLLKLLPCLQTTEDDLWWEEIKHLGNLFKFYKSTKTFHRWVQTF